MPLRLQLMAAKTTQRPDHRSERCVEIRSRSNASIVFFFVRFFRFVQARSKQLLGLLRELDVTAARFLEELCKLFVALVLGVGHVLRDSLGALQGVVED